MPLPRTRIHKSEMAYGPHKINISESDSISNRLQHSSPAVSIISLSNTESLRSAGFSSHKLPQSKVRKTEKDSSSNSYKRGSDKKASRITAKVYPNYKTSRHHAATRVNENAFTQSQSRFTAGETTCLAGHHATTCKDESRPCIFEPQTTVNPIEIKWTAPNAPNTHLNSLGTQKQFMGQRKRTNLESDATQARYRVSATQTMPYLPTPANEQTELDDLEVYRVSTILPGDGPPGLYEVEVLERHRRRWEFMKAYQCLKESGHANVIDKNRMKQIVEAFEWENLIQREEYLQECQGVRFDMVERMFEEREKKMHSLSQKRLERATERIKAKRDAAIKKIKIEFGRKARRLEAERRNLPRNYRQESIIKLLADPISDFHAPQTRFGVNPNRRHFEERGRFEERMLLMEKEILQKKRLECPFAKLKEWSAPKQEVTEIQQNFCSDKNLKKLYEVLKRLRLAMVRHKTVPKCLIIKRKRSETPPVKQDSIHVDICDKESEPHGPSENPVEECTEEESSHGREIEELRLQVLKEKEWAERIAKDNHDEEIDHMVAEFEGSTIGYLMSFLSQEAIRMDELQKLKYLNTVARKERHGREAAESGLRQKEHHLRENVELLYHRSNIVNTKKAFVGLKETVDDFAKEEAEAKALKNTTNLAKFVDMKISNWLKSVKVIQNPKNYRAVRYLLKDLIFPQLEALVKQYESQYIAGSVVESVLLPKVKKELEPYDISYSIATDMVDRLIDNDLYLFSEDSGDECGVAKLEVRAVLRKLIRWAVSGPRWKTPIDREVDGQVIEFLDDVFKTITNEEASNLEKSRRYHQLHAIISNPADADLLKDKCQSKGNLRDLDDGPSSHIQTTTYRSYRGSGDDSIDQITASLTSIPSKHFLQECRWEDESRVEISLLDFILADEETCEDKPQNEPDKISEHDALSEPSAESVNVEKLIHQIISKLIPPEADDSVEYDSFEEQEQEEFDEEDEDFIEEASNETPGSAARSLLSHILKIIPSTTFPSGESEMIEEQTAKRDGKKVELVIGKKELDKILGPGCKCRMEKEREEFVRELMKRGTLRIVSDLRKEDEEEYEINDESFEPNGEEFETQFDYNGDYEYDDDLLINYEDEGAEDENQQMNIVEQPQAVAQAEANELPLADVAQPETAVVPEAVVVPEVAVMPETAVVPEAAVLPEAAVAPEAAVVPEAVVAPEAALAPEAAVAPEAVVAPEAAVVPEAVVAPEAAVVPEAAVAPEVAAVPEAVVVPEAAIVPEQSDEP